MDFTKLDVGAEAAPAQETAFPITFEQFRNGNGAALEVTLLAATSPEGRKELRKWRLRYGSTLGDHAKADEKDLDKLAEQAEAGDVEMIARMVRAWNVQEKGGKDVPCTLENRIAFLKAFPAVADAIAAEVTRIVAELGNSKAA